MKDTNFSEQQAHVYSFMLDLTLMTELGLQHLIQGFQRLAALFFILALTQREALAQR